MIRLDPGLPAAVDALCLGISEMTRPLRYLWLAGCSAQSPAELWPEQKVWTTALDEAHARRYDREASDRMEHLPVLCAGAICGAWITNPLEHDGSITFTTDEWQVLCNFRLGLPLPSGTTFFGGCPPPTGRIRGPRPLLPGVWDVHPSQRPPGRPGSRVQSSRSPNEARRSKRFFHRLRGLVQFAYVAATTLSLSPSSLRTTRVP